MSLNSRLKQDSVNSWRVIVGHLVVAHITHFTDCEVQNPDEPPFVPFYQVAFIKHIDGYIVGDAAPTLDDAFRIVDNELRGKNIH